MSVINFKKLNQLNLDIAKKSIADYSKKNRLWVIQFDKFYNDTRIHTSPVQRMNDLLNIVRYDGWNMNRKKQCEGILRNIRDGKITTAELKDFWGIVDNLPDISLCDLPLTDSSSIDQLVESFMELRKTLNSWHSSAGTVCFLTKVILMFNWGNTPAYDTRIRKILGVKKNDLSDGELVDSLVEIGTWLHNFERQFEIDFEQFSTDVMQKESGFNLNPLPSGRGFDMMLFSL